MDRYLILSLLSGALAVDDRAGWQGLLAHPVYAGLVVGLILGEVQVGLFVGFVLELVWMSVIPMRGAKRPDQVAGAVVGTGTACLLLGTTGDPRIPFLTSIGILSGLLAGEVGVWFSRPVLLLREKGLDRLGPSSLAGGKRVGFKLWSIHVVSIVLWFLLEAVVVFILLRVSVALGGWITSSTFEPLARAGGFWQILLPAFGVASLITIYWYKYGNRFLVMGSALVFFILWIK